MLLGASAALIACSVLMVNTVYAQAQPARPDAGTFQRLQKETARPFTPDPDKRSAMPGSAPSDATAAVEAAAARVIPVSQFVFVGNTRVSSEELAAALRDFTGKVLSVNDLAAAAEAATALYHERGYNVARVVVPPQDIANQAVKLLVLEGYLDRSGIALVDMTAGRSDIPYIQAIFRDQINFADPIRRREYERALRLVDNLPGLTVRSAIYPGTQPGTARLQVELYEIPKVRGAVSMDNYGARSTGTARLSGYSIIENATGKHERIRVDASTTGSGLNFIGLDASIPVGTNGWMVGAYADYLEYDIRDAFDGSNNETGYATHVALNASYPLLLLSDISLVGSGSANYINQIDRSLSAGREDRNIGYFNFALLGERSWHFNRPAATILHAGVSFGNVNLATGIDTFKSAGDFAVVEMEINHVQRVAEQFSTHHVLRAQTASQNLNGFLKCSIGGPTSNRGYAIGQFLADSCVQFTNELIWHAPGETLGARWNLSLFLDLAQGHENIDPVPGQNNYKDTLNSFGIGANAVRTHRGELNMALARQLKTTHDRDATGRDIDQRSERYRFWVRGVLRF